MAKRQGATCKPEESAPPAKRSKRSGAEGGPREALEARWYDLMRRELPAAAKAEGGWPIRLDHCFMRVALDNLFNRCWYEVLSKEKGAVKSMSDEQLGEAVETAERMLAGGRRGDGTSWQT